jgi:alkane 1-monooxygenase
VQPHHSWNASHRLTNYFLINLQRHSDHHINPMRRFPALQHYDETQAPQLPFGYPAMLLIALVPPLWFWLMDPKVLDWHERYWECSSMQSAFPPAIVTPLENAALCRKSSTE